MPILLVIVIASIQCFVLLAVCQHYGDGFLNNYHHQIEKRQSSVQMPTTFYMCGLYPSVTFRLTDCERCRNGGKALYKQCSSAVQCVSLFRGPVECIDGQCCTGNLLDIIYPDNPFEGGVPLDPYDPNNRPYVPSKPFYPSPVDVMGVGDAYDPYNPYNPQVVPLLPTYKGNIRRESVYGNCPFGRISNIRCAAAGQCPPGRTCLNGICCPWTDENRKVACGGDMAITLCVGGTCPGSLICTASDYCCPCPVGRSVGRCDNGKCALEGYFCHTNGFCCASCPGNEMPYGTCLYDLKSFNRRLELISGQNPLQTSAYCPREYKCMIGDICCRP